MASRHVSTHRINSEVIFSAPGNILAMPEGGWGDDVPIRRSKKPKGRITKRGIDQFPRWIANVALHEEAFDDLGSFTLTRDAHFIDCDDRPSSMAQYPEPPKRRREPEIPEVTLCLPVLSVSLTATVDGTVGHAELVQKFHNPSDVIINSAKHIFPLYDGALVTSFECTIGDERRVRGVVKPKVQARKEYEEAVLDKVAAPALLEEHTPEIFETSLGNIPTNTVVEIKITYIQELKVVMMESEATEGIALTIPMSIAPRFSKSTVEWETASNVPEEKLDIWIKVLDNGKVNYKGCGEESGHILQFEGSKPVEYPNLSKDNASTGTYYVWHHESQSPILRKDFVFVVQMKEGHHIKSRATACPVDGNGLAAVMVNIRPTDLFRNAIIPQSFSGEILFLLDRSGSMGCTNSSPDYCRCGTGTRKIDVMREAMLLALSGIPSTCIFNIISWGSATVGLWGASQPHSQDNIGEAKRYVSQIEANMGSTDLLRALEAVVKRRVQERESTQIIILTDGEMEPEDSIQFIWKKRQLFGDKIRFFALGIGDEVSHRLVESIAECGGGYSDVVHTTQTPRWHDRLNRLLKSALEPNTWSCDVDLGNGYERQSSNDYNLGKEYDLENGKVPYIQAPFPILSIHPFSFASISFLVDLRHGGSLPKSVTITTTTPSARNKTYELPIEVVSGSNGNIHRLVAKAVLLGLQDDVKRGISETKTAKANAEIIGTRYSITSKWTSFVAVSENQPTQTVEERKMNHYKALLDEIDIDELLNNASEDEGSSSDSSSILTYGARQSPRMNSMAGPPRLNRPMISRNPLTTGRVLESATGISMAQYVPSPSSAMSPQPNFASNDALAYRRRPNYPTDSTPRHYVHPIVQPISHSQPASVPNVMEPQFSGDPATLDSGRSIALPRSPSVPLGSSTGSEYGRQFGSAEPILVPAPMAGHRPARPRSGMSLPPRLMVHGLYSSLDGGAAYVDVGAAQKARHHSATSPHYRHPNVDEFGQAPLSQGYPQVDAFPGAGGAPQIVPGGPKIPIYKAMSISSPRNGAAETRGSGHDSCDSSMSRGIQESSSPQFKVYGPLDWQFAMECQDGHGLFDLDGRRSSLHLHFCPEAARRIIPKIFKLLHNSVTPERQRDDVSTRVLDTLMMIECYKTHRAQQEDTWDLMMERAWYSVISALGFSDEEDLEELAGQLRGAMMHAHYVTATGVKDSEKDGSSVEAVRCPACDVAWLTARKFFCPFDHESDDVDEFTSWDDFWKHQVDRGHVLCPQEVM